jgi:hypothetical protein
MEHAELLGDDSDRRQDADGSLSPWANPVTGAPGWQLTTRSRRLAMAVATTIPGGTARPHEKGEWQACIPQAVLMVVVIDADAGVFRCRFSEWHSGVFAVTFSPWPTATVLKCPLTALPAQGRLSVRDVRVTTRMGRTVSYLIPEFTTS